MVKLPGVGNNIVPRHIWAFVDMREIPEACQINRGIYMIIETTRKQLAKRTEFWHPILRAFIKNTTIREVADEYFAVIMSCLMFSAFKEQPL
jgi:hypothetical protein